jgi:non-ribosomal peptide synthetase component F
VATLGVATPGVATPGVPAPGVPTPGAIPIGTAITGTEVYLLDESGAPVTDGQEGELYAGGDGVGLGYLNRDELTRERFVTNAFDPTGRSKLYRTGDRARRRADGNIASQPFGRGCRGHVSGGRDRGPKDSRLREIS